MGTTTTIDSRIILFDELLKLNDVKEGDYIITRNNAFMNEGPFHVPVGSKKNPHNNKLMYSSIPLINEKGGPLERAVSRYLWSQDSEVNMVMVRTSLNHHLIQIDKDEDNSQFMMTPASYHRSSLAEFEKVLGEKYQTFKERIDSIKGDYATLRIVPSS